MAAHFTPLVEGTQKALRADAAGDAFEPVGVEAGMKTLLAQLAAVLVACLAAEVDGGRVANRHACPCGGHYQFVRKQSRWLGFLFGQVQPKRALYRCRGCGRTRTPLDHVWGLQSGPYAMGRRYLTPRAQEMLARLCAAMPFEEARRHFQELTGLQVSSMMGWRLVQHLGGELQKQRERVAGVKARLRQAAGEARRWFIGADGVMVAFWTDTKRRARKPGSEATKAEKSKGTNRIVWREVKVGVVARLDVTGAIIRGSQTYLVGLMQANAFRIQLSQMARRCGVRPSDVVVVVTDGAKWLRALCTRHFPEAVAVRDFFHAAEHLGVMARALYGESSRWAAHWQRKMIKRLKQGDVATMVAEWEKVGRKPKDAHGWQREIEYFRSQQTAMAYDQFREANLPIGSGPVEGACKSTVGSRFRRPGARWSVAGFRNLAPLRARYCSGEPLMP